ncbi:M48 family metalloprotease [Arthrospira platensis BEA 1257B]
MSSTDRSKEELNPDLNSLELGLAAIKQKQYQQAIALLEPIADSQPHTKVGFKAQIGLVKAYDRSGQSDRAISLCQTLTLETPEKIRTWASNQLQQLQSRQPNPSVPPTVATGFVPFDPNLQPPKVQSTTPKAKPKPKPIPPLNKPPIEIKSDQPQKQQPQVISNSLPESPPEEAQTWTTPTETETVSHSHQWKEAERATKWRKIGKLKVTRLRIEQFLTVFILLWISPRIVEFLFRNANNILISLPVVRPIQWLYRNPNQWLYWVLGLLFIVSPWLWDGLLKLCYGQETLPRTKLLALSPEANRILQNYCKARNWKFPALRVLPTATPIAMTLGCWPRFVRIVVSQGLLDTLTPDEIATIYAREIASVGNWDFLVMSFITLLVQIPYLIYQYSAIGAQWCFERVRSEPPLIPDVALSILKPATYILRVIAFPVSVLVYGVYQILRFPALWISRRRVYYSDRICCNLTGNPNGLTRALLKMAIGISQTTPQLDNTTFLLEGLDLLTPIAPTQGMTLGSILVSSPPSQLIGLNQGWDIESLLTWDLRNPHRYWLQISNSHPLLGDRLLILNSYGKFWQIETQLNLEVKSLSDSRGDRAQLLMQVAPYLGLAIGLAIGLLIWLLGAIFGKLGIWQLEWLYGDRAILWGCVPIGVSLGIFWRNNQFFPDIKPAAIIHNPNLRDLYCNPDSIPIDSKPICIEGQLIGRSGISNIMGQELILKTASGIVPLHYIPQWTPLANFWQKSIHPSDLIGNSVKITGWWRRGATPWIDIEKLENVADRSRIYGGHPLWSVILAGSLAFGGASIISSGRL